MSDMLELRLGMRRHIIWTFFKTEKTKCEECECETECEKLCQCPTWQCQHSCSTMKDICWKNEGGWDGMKERWRPVAFIYIRLKGESLKLSVVIYLLRELNLWFHFCYTSFISSFKNTIIYLNCIFCRTTAGFKWKWSLEKFNEKSIK